MRTALRRFCRRASTSWPRVDRHGRLQLFETLLETTREVSLDARFWHYGTYRLALSGHRHLLAYLRRRLAP
jgi:hypothetical protein